MILGTGKGGRCGGARDGGGPPTCGAYFPWELPGQGFDASLPCFPAHEGEEKARGWGDGGKEVTISRPWTLSVRCLGRRENVFRFVTDVSDDR